MVGGGGKRREPEAGHFKTPTIPEALADALNRAAEEAGQARHVVEARATDRHHSVG